MPQKKGVVVLPKKGVVGVPKKRGGGRRLQERGEEAQKGVGDETRRDDETMALLSMSEMQSDHTTTKEHITREL